jgi:hypothetical protein
MEPERESGVLAIASTSASSADSSAALLRPLLGREASGILDQQQIVPALPATLLLTTGLDTHGGSSQIKVELCN